MKGYLLKKPDIPKGMSGFEFKSSVDKTGLTARQLKYLHLQELPLRLH